MTSFRNKKNNKSENWLVGWIYDISNSFGLFDTKVSAFGKQL